MRSECPPPAPGPSTQRVNWTGSKIYNQNEISKNLTSFQSQIEVNFSTSTQVQTQLNKVKQVQLAKIRSRPRSYKAKPQPKQHLIVDFLDKKSLKPSQAKELTEDGESKGEPV